MPFFLLAGEFMNAGGLSRRIVNLAMAWVGHFRGGLGYVAVLAAVIMASLSGSAVADTAALAALLIPMMKQAGYEVNRSAGLIAAGGIIAPVIPPSIGMIIFGVAGNVSITKLFLAGIVPGILMGVAIGATWWWIAKRDDIQPAPRMPMAERLKVTAAGRLGAGPAGRDPRRHEVRRVHARPRRPWWPPSTASWWACSSTASSSGASCTA